MTAHTLRLLINDNLTLNDQTSWDLSCLSETDKKIESIYPTLEHLTVRSYGPLKIQYLLKKGLLIDLCNLQSSSMDKIEFSEGRNIQDLTIKIYHPMQNNRPDLPFISEYNLKHILSQCKQLKSLFIQSLTCKDSDLEDIAALKTLEKIKIYCQVKYTQKGYVKIVENCPNLKTLNIHCMSNIPYSYLQKMAKQLPLLEKLNLRPFDHTPGEYRRAFDKCFNWEDMKAVINSFPHLKSLSHVDCSDESKLRKAFPDLSINGIKGKDIKPVSFREIGGGEDIDLFDNW